MQQYIILRNFTYDIEKEYLESDIFIFAMSSHSESLPFASLFSCVATQLITLYYC